jgi:hypothetical protein
MGKEVDVEGHLQAAADILALTTASKADFVAHAAGVHGFAGGLLSSMMLDNCDCRECLIHARTQISTPGNEPAREMWSPQSLHGRILATG